MKHAHQIVLRALALVVTWLVLIPVAVLSYDPYSPYDPYSGSYGSYGVDYDNSAWSPSAPAGGSSNSGSDGYNASASDITVPDGAVKVKLIDDSGYAKVIIESSNTYEGRAVGDWSAKKIYKKVQATGLPDYSQSIGQIEKIAVTASKVGSLGYIYLDQLDGPSTVVSAEAAAGVDNSTEAIVVVGNNTAIQTTVAPKDTTAVYIKDGKVYRADNNYLLIDARYDPVGHKIYFQNTASIYGGMLTKTTGYVNIKPLAVVEAVYDYTEYKAEKTPAVVSSPLLAEADQGAVENPELDNVADGADGEAQDKPFESTDRPTDRKEAGVGQAVAGLFKAIIDWFLNLFK